MLVAGLIVGASALSRQSDARNEIIDQLDPARTASLQLGAAIVAQQNGLRGFALNGLDSSLEAYDGARADARRSRGGSRSRCGEPELTARVAAIGTAMESWRAEFADPGIARIRREGPSPTPGDRATRSAASFARVTGALGALNADIAARRADAKERLDDASRSTTVSFFVIAGALALALVAVAVAMSRASRARSGAWPPTRGSSPAATSGTGSRPTAPPTSSGSRRTSTRCASASSPTCRRCARAACSSRSRRMSWR